MRNALLLLAPVSLLALAACADSADHEAGEPVEEAVSAPADAGAEAAPNADTAPRAGDGGGQEALPDIPVTLPKMAYVFDYGFRLPGAAIGPLQQQHADMCEAQGPYACRIVSLTRTGEDEDEIYGELELAVVADKARGFGALLAASAEAVDAETFRANIEGEDLSKNIVDTEARVRSRVALRDRLLEVLKTRRGTVEELVEAERQVAAVNEEIDQAQSWLAEQRGRVSYSRMTLSYESATPGGSFVRPVEGALGSLGSIFGTIVAVLILLAAIAGPFLLGALGFRWLSRKREVVEA